MNQQIKTGLGVVIILLFTATVGAFVWQAQKEIGIDNDNNQIQVKSGGKMKACTEEAKQCPDGSYVARTGPNCEFAPCPEKLNENDNVPVKPIDTASKAEDKNSCEKAGGVWRLAMKPEAPGYCVMPASDIGKKCTDSGQCKIYCQAPENAKPGSKVIGYCSDHTGDTCSQEVKNGIASSGMCQ